MKRSPQIYLASFGILTVTIVLSVIVGAVFIPLDDMFSVFLGTSTSETFSAILLKVRVPHMVLILLTGSALGGSGAAYQGLFRNPLADPYLIGVASGASLGAVFAMSVQADNNPVGFYTIPVAAFIGSGATGFLGD